MLAFIDGPIAGEALTKVGVQATFVTMHATATKGNGMQDGFQVGRNEGEVTASHVGMHGIEGGIVIARL